MDLHRKVLQEETLQQIIRRHLVEAGTLHDAVGRDAAAVATLLRGKSGDKAFVIKFTPNTANVLGSIAGTRASEQSDSDDHGILSMVRMPGGAKLVVYGDGENRVAVTNEENKDRLIGGQ